jgi:cell division protein FtsB
MSETVSRRFSRALGIFALALAAYYALLGGEYDFGDMRRLRGEHSDREARIDSLGSELEDARAWADSLETDERVIERVARERYSFIRPGEILFRFVDDEIDSDGADDETAGPVPDGG